MATDSYLPPKSETLTPLKAITGRSSAANVSACFPQRVSLTEYCDLSTRVRSRFCTWEGNQRGIQSRWRETYLAICFRCYFIQTPDLFYDSDDVYTLRLACFCTRVFDLPQIASFCNSSNDIRGVKLYLIIGTLVASKHLTRTSLA